MSDRYSQTNNQATITDVGGTGRTYPAGGAATTQILCTAAIATEQTYGIQVGTGSAANDGTTHALSSIINHGVAAGTLSYGAMGITAPLGTVPLSMTFTRTFTNNSGNTINITEAGLVVSGEYGLAQGYFMIIRDTGFGTVQVLNLANTTATYTMYYTIA